VNAIRAEENVAVSRNAAPRGSFTLSPSAARS